MSEWPNELVALYESTYRQHVKLVYAMVGSRHEAEEVVQDAYVALSGKWADVERPVPYLRRSVVNRSIALLRRRAVAEHHRPEPPPPGQPAFLVELRDCLLELPQRQRAAIALRYLDGLDDDEIAEVLGCRRGTVRSLVSRGLATLRTEVPR